MGLIAIATGLFTVVSPLIIEDGNSTEKALLIGGLAIVVGLMIVASYGGTLFDFKEARYKKYYSVSGIRVGQWTPLPEIRSIKVFPHTFKATRTDGIHPSTGGEVVRYKMALYANQSEPVMVFENHEKDKTIKEAEILSQQLKTTLEIK